MLAKSELLERVRATLTSLGYELVDLEFQRTSGLMRVFIDRVGGITVDDCAVVSNQLVRVLEVEAVSYQRLEVSSPGLDRRLNGVSDYVRFSGNECQVKLRSPLDRRRRWRGVLRGCDGGRLLLEVEGAMREIDLVEIDEVRLVPQI